MTIQDLGSIGKALGAVATVATLAYLAIQIRANTAAMRSEARRSHFAINPENNQLVVTHHDVADIMVRGLVDPKALDVNENTRFTFLMANFVNNAELGFFERKVGVIDDDEVTRTLKATARFLRAPGGAEFWARHGRNYLPNFCAAIEEMIFHSSTPKPR